MTAAAIMESFNLENGPRLPIEIILRIIEALAPSIPGGILPSTDDAAKTLLAFTRVCRNTSSLASDMLAKHCAYIDSPAKAETFAKRLAMPKAPKIERLFLSPFPPIMASPASSVGNGWAFDTSSAAVANESVVAEAFEAQSELTEYAALSPLDNMRTCTAVRKILLALAPTLRSLAIDMPLRSLYPRDDHNGVRPMLRQGFEALVNLEEFVSVQDELYLRTTISEGPNTEPDVWATLWPKVRRLAFYNLDLCFDMDNQWEKMARLPLLETVVFTRADFGNLTRYNFKEKWLKAVQGKDRSKKLKIILVDCYQFQPTLSKKLRQIWRDLDPLNNIRVLCADVAVPKRCAAGKDWDWDTDCNPISITQDFIKMHATIGTLWDEAAMEAQPMPLKPSKRS